MQTKVADESTSKESPVSQTGAEKVKAVQRLKRRFATELLFRTVKEREFNKHSAE